MTLDSRRNLVAGLDQQLLKDWTIRYGNRDLAGRPALFLDRDGTLMENVPYLAEPAKVVLAPGSEELLARFRNAGYAIIVVTNQSGVARGLITHEAYRAVQDRFCELLGENRLDLVLACPFFAGGHPPYDIAHPWRKPAPGMLLAARAMLGIDLPSSILIGDSGSDIEAAVRAGLRLAIKVETFGDGDSVVQRASNMDNSGAEGNTEIVYSHGLLDILESGIGMASGSADRETKFLM